MTLKGVAKHLRAPLPWMLLAALSISAAQVAPEPTPPEAPEIKIVPQSGVFFAYGDIRFTDESRCNISDPLARRAIVNEMAHTDVKPDFIVMTGDVVYHGDDKDDWHIFDDETKDLRDRKIRLLPVLGNHDVHGHNGQSNFVEHFEELKRYPQLKTNGWYSVDYGNVQFIMLDSQTTYKSQTPQGDWLESQLKRVPDDLDFLVIALHHPVVTHPSRIPFITRCKTEYPVPGRAHEVEDAEQYLKRVLEKFTVAHPHTKVLVLSGHNHNYERYVVNGITYVVTAGGGATPYPIRRKLTDAYHEPGPTYHYCSIKVDGHTLSFAMHKLNRATPEPTFEIKDSFQLRAEDANAAAAAAGKQ